MPHPTGRLWFVADDAHQAAVDTAKHMNMGATLVSSDPRIDPPRVHYQIELEKARAKEILGYEPDPMEWQDQYRQDHRTQHYFQTFTALKATMQALIERIDVAVRQDALAALSPPAKPYMSADEEIGLNADWKLPHNDKTITGVTIRLSEPEDDPVDEPEQGAPMYALSLDVIGEGGQWINTLTPGAYTDDLYTPDLDTLRERLDQMDSGYIAHLITQHIREVEIASQRPAQGPTVL